MLGIPLLTLLHILVPIYWLGGDLGAFYSSRFITDPQRSVAERMLALKILNNIDMAPRTTLIMALPTGLLLAWAKGWLAVPSTLVAVIVLAALGWLALAWAVHLRHGPGGQGLKRIDLGIRWAVMLALATAGLLGLAHRIELPLFIALKLLILALAIASGLLIRRLLVPLFAPVAAMARGQGTAEGDRVIAGVISRTRPVVIGLWILVLGASLLGLWTPV